MGALVRSRQATFLPPAAWAADESDVPGGGGSMFHLQRGAAERARVATFRESSDCSDRRGPGGEVEGRGHWQAGSQGRPVSLQQFPSQVEVASVPLWQGVPRDSTRLLQPAPRPRGNGNAQAAGLWLFIRRGQGRLPGQDDSLDDGRGGSSGPASSAAAARRATEDRAETGPWGSAAGQWRGGACPSIVAVSLSLPQW